MTLLAAGNMSSVLQFADFGTNNRYASSYLKTAIDALAEKLTTEENTAVKKRTLTSGSYNGENTDCVAGEQVDNAVFWPLSTAEAFAVNQDLRIVDPEHPSWASSYWWLRSPGYSDHDAATVNGDGSVVYSGNAISSWWCVRPAFNLNSSSVLFTSAAVGGKPDGGLTPISKYTGNEWKLTLKDSNRNFAVTETTVSGDPGDTVTLHYTGATAGINEYISVILADNSGAQYYGRVAQPTAENGTVEIKIPSGLAPGSYTLKVFSEQCNDDKKTDYASDFVDIDLTVGYQEQFTLTPGGVYYFDLSGVSIPGTANGSLPDKTMHYVPFTYAGTVDAYKLTSEMATTEEYAQQNEYAHSLFVADYAVTHAVSWDDLNATGLIFWQRLRHRQRGLYAACAVRGKWWYRLGCFRTRHAPKQRMGQDTGQGRRIYQKLERYRFLGTRYFTQYAIEPCDSRPVRFAPQICRRQYYALLPVPRFPPRP